MGRSANGQNVLAGGATIAQISAVSESESVSSTSTPRYRTVFSILLRPSKIKECSVSEANFSIQEEADRPDLPDFQGAFGTDLPASVPSRPAYRGRVILRDTHCISPRRNGREKNDCATLTTTAADPIAVVKSSLKAC